MALITEIRKNVTESTPLMAMVGATDYAAERVREAAANAAHLQVEVEKALTQLEAKPKEWRERARAIDVKTVQEAPVLVLHRARELAGRVEESYGRLADRGKDLVERARQAALTYDVVNQGKVTVDRVRAAVATARQAVDDTAEATKRVLTVGRQEAGEVVTAVEAEVVESVAATEKAVAGRTQGTRAAVRGAATTVRRRAVSTRTATRSVATSAGRTAKKAVAAVEAVAGQIGETPSGPAAPDAAEAPTAPAETPAAAEEKGAPAPAE